MRNTVTGAADSTKKHALTGRYPFWRGDSVAERYGYSSGATRADARLASGGFE